MTDKTAIEKALTEMISLADRLYVAEKEALSHTRNEEYLKTIVSMIEDAREALAALEAEKPAEDVELDDLVVKIYESAWDWGLGEGELETLIQQYAKSYHAEQCKACSKWISVKDRLPETIGDEWLVCDIDKKVFSAWYWPNSGWNDGEVPVSVTHWQPLPEAPK